jgi:hypothetical protein
MALPTQKGSAPAELGLRAPHLRMLDRERVRLLPNSFLFHSTWWSSPPGIEAAQFRGGAGWRVVPRLPQTIERELLEGRNALEWCLSINLTLPGKAGGWRRPLPVG